MRPVIAVLMVLPALAGCLSDEGPQGGDTTVAPLMEDAIEVPVGATLEAIEGGFAAVWNAVESPFEANITIPEGATLVRWIADPGDDTSVSVTVSHADTGRRRCNQQPVVDLGASLLGARSCSSIAAIDPPGTQWTVSAFVPGGAGGFPLPTGGATEAPTLSGRVEFLDVPLDGIAGQLDWSQLSHATHDLLPTEGFYLNAHDGVELWVEVTLPDGEGPWPTVIAASPYNGQGGRIPDPGEGAGEPGTPAMWTYWTQDYAKRGYAAVNIDVRGFGKSGGCVEVWGINEQLDQKLIVDWVADQEWSDGKVGFYGQSYVATTPVAAAVQAPEALKAIIAVAPVIDAYHDWHYGGVPNGESSLSPVAYQVLVDGLGAFAVAADPTFATDVATLASYAAKGLCDPTLIPLANDPRAIHGPYYDERDFGARAGDVEAAVLFTQGFEDANVKSAMINDWFNGITAPKLGVFGHWLHQHPARADAEALFLGWMDHYVKGRDLGFDALPSVVVNVDAEHERTADAWPPLTEEAGGPALRHLGLDLDANEMVWGEGSGSQAIDVGPLAHTLAAATVPGNPTGTHAEVLRITLNESLPLVNPVVHLAGTIDGENGFLYAELYEDYEGSGTRLLTYGSVNLALRDDVDSYEPFLPGDAFAIDLPLRPTEHIVAEGSTLRLVVSGVPAAYATGLAQPQPGRVILDGATSSLVVPDVPLADFAPLALTSMP